VTDKIFEEALKYVVSFLLGGIVFGIGKALKWWSDARVREVELKRELNHIKRNQETQSRLLAQIDAKLDAQDDLAALFDKRISLLEVYAKHNTSGFQRITLRES
jgi:uncharacterized protein YabE (DUF348 family)